MRIVLDRDKLVFLPIKHHDLNVVCNLAWIECPSFQAAYVTALDHTFLSDLSDLERMLLYRNTTGQTAMKIGQQLVSVLMELAERIPEREVNAREAEAQAMCVPEQRAERYLYALGQMKPQRQTDVFMHPAVALVKSASENDIAKRAPVAAPVPDPTAPRPTVQAAPRATGSGAPRAPRQGGAKDVIWGAADKHWEAAGKPTDVSVVLKLRKEVMGILEAEHAVKKTTSSNELGNWMKDRLGK